MDTITITDTRTFTFEGTPINPEHPDFGGAPAFTSATGLDEVRSRIDTVFEGKALPWRQVLSLAGTYGVVYLPDDVRGTLAGIADRLAVGAGVAVHDADEVVTLTRTA